LRLKGAANHAPPKAAKAALANQSRFGGQKTLEITPDQSLKTDQ